MDFTGCRRSTILAAALLSVMMPVAVSAAGEKCMLGTLAELPVTMEALRPTVKAQINGQDVLLALDSGAVWSMLTPAAAAQYNLQPNNDRRPLFFEGVGGRTLMTVTTVKTFTVFGVSIHNVDFLVGGNAVGQGTAGLLGQNLLRIADIEYDLGHGAIRIFGTKNCRHANLAYWVKPGSPYSQLDIKWTTVGEPHTIGSAELDGKKIRVLFDSGAWSSIVGMQAAARAGITPNSPGVEFAGWTGGIGRRPVRTWTANFPVLKIGDEEIHNARLRFGDIGGGPGGDIGMLVGADFFLSHRIYVSDSQSRLYFTYNGGPVFDLKAAEKAQAAADAQLPKGQEGQSGQLGQSGQSGGSGQPGQSGQSGQSGESGQSKDGAPVQAAGPAAAPDNVGADQIARHAAALASRHDFQHALEEFNRACTLAPGEASYYFGRARVLYALNDADRAYADLEQAIKLNPEYIDALLTRARVRVSQHDTAGALADLATADRVAPRQADLRLEMARVYAAAESLPGEIAQLDLWIAYHAEDLQVAGAYRSRCWARALRGEGLDKALGDCNAGMSRARNAPGLLEARGLVFLRSGQYDRAISDYDAALKTDPDLAWALYGRGIARLRKGMSAQGQADIDAAKALSPSLPEEAGKYGINP